MADKTTKILNLPYTGILVETDMTLKIDWLYAIPELWEKIWLDTGKLELRYTGILGETDMTPKVYRLNAIPEIWVNWPDSKETEDISLYMTEPFFFFRWCMKQEKLICLNDENMYETSQIPTEEDFLIADSTNRTEPGHAKYTHVRIWELRLTKNRRL